MLSSHESVMNIPTIAVYRKKGSLSWTHVTLFSFFPNIESSHNCQTCNMNSSKFTFAILEDLRFNVNNLICQL